MVVVRASAGLRLRLDDICTTHRRDHYTHSAPSSSSTNAGISPGIIRAGTTRPPALQTHQSFVTSLKTQSATHADLVAFAGITLIVISTTATSPSTAFFPSMPTVLKWFTPSLELARRPETYEMADV